MKLDEKGYRSSLKRESLRDYKAHKVQTCGMEHLQKLEGSSTKMGDWSAALPSW